MKLKKFENFEPKIRKEIELEKYKSFTNKVIDLVREDLK